MFKKFLIGFIKLSLYVAFVGAAIVYTPKLLSRALHTPYPLATITSASMWPTLKTDDLILMEGAAGSNVEVGQIIVFKNPKGFTIHRLIKKENDRLITKGDANNVEDAPISSADVIGRVVYISGQPFRIPYLGVIARNLGPAINNFK